MPDAADALAGAVVGFLDALELENVYDNPHGMATHDRIAAAVITRLVSRKNGTLAPHVADQLRSFSQSLSGSTASSTSSSALAGSEGRHDSPISTLCFSIRRLRLHIDRPTRCFTRSTPPSTKQAQSNQSNS